MANPVDEARDQIDIARQELVQGVVQLDTRLRHQLDWKAHVRRDGPRALAVGAVLMAVAIGRSVLKPKKRARKSRSRAEKKAAASLDDLARQVRLLQEQLMDEGELKRARETSRRREPLWQKAVLRAVATAAAAGGAHIAKQFMESSSRDDQQPQDTSSQNTSRDSRPQHK